MCSEGQSLFFSVTLFLLLVNSRLQNKGAETKRQVTSPRSSDLSGSFCKQLYQRLINSVILVGLALQFYIKFLIRRLNKCKCSSLPCCHRYLYLGVLRGKYFKTKVFIERIEKNFICCKVKKNSTKCCKMFCSVQNHF